MATDAETGTMLDLYISSLPNKGDLYHTADGAADTLLQPEPEPEP